MSALNHNLPAPLLATEETVDWYRPGKCILAFHQSKARIRVLVGARGCGKTTGVAVEAITHGLHNAGARIYVLRKTQDSNEDSTQKTFELVFAQMGSGYTDNGYSLFKKIEGGAKYRLPSKKAVELFNTFMKTKPKKGQIEQWLDTVGSRFCSFIHFSGVPDATKRDTRFRGYECSMLIFVEADQLAREDLDMALFCLRWKGADPATCDELGFIRDTCCILDTNPPSPKHWIAQMEQEHNEKHMWPDAEWWHIPMEENGHNLRPGYVEEAKQLYANNSSMYNRMVLGLYDEAFDGSPVLFAFSEAHAFNNLPWPRGAYLVRGWDFGTTQAVTWAAYWEEGGDEYWWDLFEYFATNSDVERQCREVWRLTDSIFPFWNNRLICAGVFDACDPAGNQRTDKGKSLDVLATHQVYPKFNTKHRSLQLTLAAYNRLLEKRDRYGRLVYRICKVGCPMLYSASRGGYRYPREGEAGFKSGEPLKGPDGGNFDHVADAARYAKVNFLRLMRVEMEKLQRPVGNLVKNTAPNPKKRWW